MNYRRDSFKPNSLKTFKGYSGLMKKILEIISVLKKFQNTYLRESVQAFYEESLEELPKLLRN